MENFLLNGKTAIVTGGGGHLCGSMCTALCEMGANVIVSDINLDKAVKVKDKLLGSGYVAESFCHDASNNDDWNNITKFAIDKYGKIDILINGAGINDSTPFFDISLSAWRKVMSSQLEGTFLGCQSVGKIMCSQKSGSIVNISSASAGPPLSKAFAYSCAKAGILNLTQNLAREWALDGVRVNAIRPGFFPTEWNRKNFITKERETQILDHTAMKRFGEPKELNSAIIWLNSDGASFVTGAEIAIDGGFSCMTI